VNYVKSQSDLFPYEEAHTNLKRLCETQYKKSEEGRSNRANALGQSGTSSRVPAQPTQVLSRTGRSAERPVTAPSPPRAGSRGAQFTSRPVMSNVNDRGTLSQRAGAFLENRSRSPTARSVSPKVGEPVDYRRRDQRRPRPNFDNRVPDPRLFPLDRQGRPTLP